jgi:hypothetical protein
VVEAVVAPEFVQSHLGRWELSELLREEVGVLGEEPLQAEEGAEHFVVEK